MKKLKWIFGLALIAITIASFKFYRILPERISLKRYEQMLDEITSLEVSIATLTPDFHGRNLAYIHSTDSGRGVALIDLVPLKRKEIILTNEVTLMGGWSPDDRYLAFVQRPPVPANYRTGDFKESWLTLFDTKTDTVRRLTDDQGVTETYFFFWLTTNSYIFVSGKLTNTQAGAQIYLGNLDQNAVQKVSHHMPELVTMSDKSVGGIYNGNISELEIKPLQISKGEWDESTRTVHQLSAFDTNNFDQLKWLRYSHDTGQFLFCARPTNSTWRYLYQFNRQDKKLTQLSHEDTYNGQYLQNGRGYAYVGNPNNSFYLAVRPGALGTDAPHQSESTNLFTHGSVVSYAASPDGNRIYAHGAIGDEPQGIWEYSLVTRSLRQVANGMNKPFVASRVIAPDEIKVKSFDGLDVPCFFFTPPAAEGSARVPRAGSGVPPELSSNKLSSSSQRNSQGNEVLGGSPKTARETRALPGFFRSFLPRTKYPAVIYIPPNTAQMQRSFGPRSQLLANIGFYFLAVNYRGVDGYGRDYASMGDSEAGAKDILAAYHWLIKNPNIDRENIFIFSMSGGTGICMELLATEPKLWRGMAIDKPGSCPIDSRFEPGKMPPLLFITGDQDTALPSIQKFTSWALSNHVELNTFIYTNAAHITFDLESRKRSQKQVADFYLEHLK